MIGDNIRNLRKKKGITMRELGQAIGGMAESTVGMYETNRRVPEYETLEKLARFFNVPIHAITEQSIYEPETRAFIMANMGLILEIMKRDFKDAEKNTYADENGKIMNSGIPLTFIELIETLEPEMQFKSLSAFLMNVKFNEDTKEIGLLYYK